MTLSGRLWFATVIATTTPVYAGGMVLPVRGVHALERAGALVAGADDADALWLDPAGLAHLAGDGTKAFLFDIAYVYQTVDYTPVDSLGTPQAGVTNQQPGSPIPTLAGAMGIGDDLVIAGGIAAPYAGLHRYDDTGPQRYASVSLANSTFVIVTAGVAYRISPRLRVGATLQDLVSHVSSRLALSGCPGQTTCAPGDRSFDMLAQIDQSDYLAPSGSLGVQFDATPDLTLGATLQAPTRIGGTGSTSKFASSLPTSRFFDGATLTGDRASLGFTLPPAARLGVEYRHDGLHVELALDVELWGLHDKIDLVPENVQIDHLATGTLVLAPMAIPRDYHTSYAPSIGVEWHVAKASFAAGYSYETAAAPTGEVSVFTVDAAKHVVGLGGGYEAYGWQIGAAVGLAQLATVDVAPADAKVPQLTPLHDAPSEIFVNAGSYRSRYLLAGLRFARRF